MYKKIKEFIATHPDSRAILELDNNLLYIVDDAKRWHEMNVLLNSKEYYRKGVINKYRDKIIDKEGSINYGVIDFKDFSNSMIDWENMAVSSLLLGNIDVTYYPNSNWDVGGRILSSCIRKNRDNAVLVSLLANKGVVNVKDLLYWIFTLRFKNKNLAIKYVDDNYLYLKHMYNLNDDQIIYEINGDKVRLVYDRMLLHDKNIVPKSLFQYLKSKKIDIEDKKRVLVATRNYLMNKTRKDKDILNDSCNKKIVRSSSYTFKR